MKRFSRISGVLAFLALLSAVESAVYLARDENTAKVEDPTRESAVYPARDENSTKVEDPTSHQVLKRSVLPTLTLPTTTATLANRTGVAPTGYDISGAAQLNCRADGSESTGIWWPAVLPKCNPVTCPKPPKIANGNYDETYAPEASLHKYGDSNVYSCNDGYRLFGNPEVKCNKSGEWDGVPYCVATLTLPTTTATTATLANRTGVAPTAAECPDLNGTLANGVVKVRQVGSGKRAKYTCNKGYYLNGVMIRTCESTKNWSNVAPTCTKGCARPSKYNNAYPDVPFDMVFEVGNVVNYTCFSGYTLSDPADDVGIECRADFTWSPVQFYCERVLCGHPGMISNGILVGEGRVEKGVLLDDNFDFGSYVTYKCNPGYDISGAAQLSCRADGSKSTGIWRPPVLPKCIPVTCPKPPKIANGNYDETYAPEASLHKYGDSFVYSCNDGYKLFGNPEVKCNKMRKWDGNPSCVAVTCPRPPIIANGNYDETNAPDHKFGNFLMYSCNHGYKLIGNSEVKCNKSGEWDGVPYCVVNLDCDFEAYSNNTNQGTCGYTVTSGTFSCEEQEQSNTVQGYSLKGEGVLRSVEIPLAGDKELCIELEYMATQQETLQARAAYLNETKLLWTADISITWKRTKFILVTVKSHQNSTFLEFVATADVILDNIKQIDNAECATLTLPTTTATTTPATATLANRTGVAPTGRWRK